MFPFDHALRLFIKDGPRLDALSLACSSDVGAPDTREHAIGTAFDVGSSMLNTLDSSATNLRFVTFKGAEIRVLIEAYRFVLSYLGCTPPLDACERNDLARLTLMAAFTRRRLGKGLGSIVDAHALAAEIIDVFLTLQDLDSMDVPRTPRGLLCL